MSEEPKYYRSLRKLVYRVVDGRVDVWDKDHWKPAILPAWYMSIGPIFTPLTGKPEGVGRSKP